LKKLKYGLSVCLTLLVLTCFSQEDQWQWWNEAHNWKPGMPGWRNWIILSPGYLGPNALPVPELKKGFIPVTGEVEVSLSRHFHPEDPTQDLSGKFFYPIFNGIVAVEAYGVILENYYYTEELRDERFSRDKDGMGIIPGDFYFSTLIQLCKDRRFPNTVLRLACKTASGDAFAARFTDTPGYFFDFSSSRDFELSRHSNLRTFGTLGFYSWQTYNEATPQNDALLYGAGVDYLHSGWQISGQLSGYSGYLKIHDRPCLLTFEGRYDWMATAVRLQFLYGLHDWNYQTLRFSFIWKFDGKN